MRRLVKLAPDSAAASKERMKYEAAFESLNQHPAPDWLHDAKLGLFVQWAGTRSR